MCSRSPNLDAMPPTLLSCYELNRIDETREGMTRDETSPPTISASGRRPCCAAGRVAHRSSAVLSFAAGALDRGVWRCRLARHHRTPDEPMAVGAAWAAIRGLESGGR